MKNVTPTMGLGLADTLSLLRSEGFDNANGPRIYYAITAGKIERPQLDGSRSYRFGKKDLQAIRSYLSVVPSRGRPSAIHS